MTRNFVTRMPWKWKCLPRQGVAMRIHEIVNFPIRNDTVEMLKINTKRPCFHLERRNSHFFNKERWKIIRKSLIFCTPIVLPSKFLQNLNFTIFSCGLVRRNSLEETPGAGSNFLRVSLRGSARLAALFFEKTPANLKIDPKVVTTFRGYFWTIFKNFLRFWWGQDDWWAPKMITFLYFLC